MISELGFIKVGQWTASGDSLICELVESSNQPNLIYLFANETKLFYLGMTKSALSTRMYGYMRPGKSQRTNMRIKQKLLELLSSGDNVDIYILFPEDEFVYGGVKLDSFAGLEGPLIRLLKPTWNILGKPS